MRMREKKQVHVMLFMPLLMLAATLMMLQGMVVHAADDFSGAVGIQVNTAVAGTITDGYNRESDLYRFTLSDAGSVSLQFSNPLQGSTEDFWKMSLYNASYDEIIETKVAGNHATTNSTTIGLGAGTYYIKVTSANYDNAKSTDRYTMTVQYTASNVWEKELNDGYLSATDMALNTSYYGTTRYGSDGEKDYYKFQTPADGKVSIRFSNPLQNSADAYWKINIYDSAYNRICEQDITGNASVTDLPNLGLPAGTYYVLVESAGRWRDSVSSTDTYAVYVGYQTSDVWEKELNEDFTSATKMALGKDYYGSTWSGSDYEKDYFQFTINRSGLYSICITTPYLQEDKNYWFMDLYDGQYEKLKGMEIRGNKTSHEIVRMLDPGTYYAVIKSDSRWAVAKSTDDYRLKVSETTQAHMQETCEHDYQKTYVDATYFKNGYTINTCNICGKQTISDYTAKKKLGSSYIYKYNCSAGKAKLVIKWNTVYGAQGYQIRYSNSKNMKSKVVTKTIKGGSKYKKTLSKLKRRKVYYVQVRPYVKSGSQTAYGAWSNKLRMKTR